MLLGLNEYIRMIIIIVAANTYRALYVRHHSKHFHRQAHLVLTTLYDVGTLILTFWMMKQSMGR